jgi:hypothetical protein
MATHYGTTVLPARPYHPKDKAKVEVGVQVVQRWILARLRNRTFFTLDALNLAIAELCDELNDRPMRHYGQSRNQLFEKLDRPALRPLRLSSMPSGSTARSTSTTTSRSTTTSTRCPGADSSRAGGPHHRPDR